MAAPRRKWFILAGIGGVIALAFWFANHRATQLITTLFRDVATSETARLSDSVYTLRVGTLQVNWARRQITLDSASLTTDTARNARRRRPMAATSVALRHCTLGGISIIRLVTGRGLTASVFGCRDVVFSSDAPAGPSAVEVRVPGQAAPPARQGSAPDSGNGDFLTLQETLKLPRQVPRLRIAQIAFPNVSINLVQRYERGNQLTFNLERARVSAERLAIDNNDPAMARRPLFSQAATLSARNAQFLPDTATVARVRQLDADLTDSVMTIQGLSYGPNISDAAFAAQRPWRRDRMRVRAETLTARGMDFNRFVRTGAIRVRKLMLDSLRFEIRTDKRKPPRRPHIVRRWIQQTMAASARSWQIDTVAFRRAEVVYEDFSPGHEAPARLVFGHIEATGTSFRHALGGPRTSLNPFVLDAKAMFMERGPFHVRFEVPLDAPDFAMRVDGRLGAMPAEAINPIVAYATPTEVKSGDIQSIVFAFQVSGGGVAVGTVTPLYTGFELDITGRGMTGILGNRGIVGDIARGAARIMAGRTVKEANPGRPGEPPRVGTIRYTFSGESLPAFLWKSLRTGLLPVVVK